MIVSGTSRLCVSQLSSLLCGGLSGTARRTFTTGLQANYDVVIVGGSVVGNSVAYHLAEKLGSGASICVIERDPTYTKCSAVLSAGGIRQQFSGKENIELSQYSIDFLRNIDRLAVEGKDVPCVQFVEGGYLFLASEAGEPILRENHAVQRAMGHDVRLLDVDELVARYEWMNPDGVALASLGLSNEGWFDPWTLISALKYKAIDLGVTYVHGEVCGMEQGEGGRVESVQYRPASDPSSANQLGCGWVVNAAGAWSYLLTGMVTDVPYPVRPRKRSVFYVHAPDLTLKAPDAMDVTDDRTRGPKGSGCPLVVNPNGVYFRPEGGGTSGHFICGVSPTAEWGDANVDEEEMRECGGGRGGGDWGSADHELFEEVIWPTLAERSSALERLKVQSSWVGLYEYNTLDQNAIIGLHPLVPNMALANGFSGHGLQQSPAVGRAVAELLASGGRGYETVDCTPFAFERVLENRPLRERNIV